MTGKAVKMAMTLLVLFIVGFTLYSVTRHVLSGQYGLPKSAQRNPMIKEAYLFAQEHPDLLRQMPCYCGCSNIGHKNNYECYFDDAGNFIEHASLCGGCTGITLDVKRMYGEGKSIEEMHTFIDEKYGGPGMGHEMADEPTPDDGARQTP